MKTLKAVMPRSEELKKLLKAQYDIEYADYLQMLEIEKQRQDELLEEQRKLKLQQEGTMEWFPDISSPDNSTPSWNSRQNRKFC